MDLAGGTLDCWPLPNLWGDAVTINVSIDILTRCSLRYLDNAAIVISSKDLGLRREYANLDVALASKDPLLALPLLVLNYFKPLSGFELEMHSESPVGGGLGGSSSLCVSLIKAFSQHQDVTFSRLEVVELAHNLEGQLLRLPTGTQDYFPPLEKGLHFIHYQPMGIKDEVFSLPDRQFLVDHFVLVYTGKPHHSGFNNWQVIKAALDGDTFTLDCLSRLRSVAFKMKTALQGGDWHSLPELFRAEFQARSALSKAFSSPQIELLEKVALSQGASAVKICGAGGGGCVLVWCPPKAHSQLERACQSEGFQVLKAKPLL